LYSSLIHSGLEHGNFFNTDISQGSVATHLKCDGTVNGDFPANLLVNLPVKEFWNQSTFGKVMGRIMVAYFFDWQCTWHDVQLISIKKQQVLTADNLQKGEGNYVDGWTSSSLFLIFPTVPTDDSTPAGWLSASAAHISTP